MEEIGAFDAKNHLSRLLDEAEKGKEFIITKHGRPVAKIGPLAPVFDHEKARKAVEGLRRSRKGMKLRGLKIKDLINEGRP